MFPLAPSGFVLFTSHKKMFVSQELYRDLTEKLPCTDNRNREIHIYSKKQKNIFYFFFFFFNLPWTHQCCFAYQMFSKNSGLEVIQLEIFDLEPSIWRWYPISIFVGYPQIITLSLWHSFHLPYRMLCWGTTTGPESMEAVSAQPDLCLDRRVLL